MGRKHQMQGLSWCGDRVLGEDEKIILSNLDGNPRAYHVDVIEAFRLALKNDLNMMRKYRR